jgi:5-keto 4-deoxyuronate isomerase
MIAFTGKCDKCKDIFTVEGNMKAGKVSQVYSSMDVSVVGGGVYSLQGAGLFKVEKNTQLFHRLTNMGIANKCGGKIVLFGNIRKTCFWKDKEGDEE